ncbi:MAG: DNA polymerase III subunit [Chloroflexi bacterium]|nr:DNA polymerase III subunit [Chloroflexota bacterium]
MRSVIGHHQAIALLRRAIESDRPSHAYLIVGPPHIGKATLARQFAQALNCQGIDRPCGACGHCRRIADNNHPDVRIARLGVSLSTEMTRSSRPPEKNIGIDDVRAIQHEAFLAPYSGRWKVYVVLDAEDLSRPAMNSFLKLLEEPPPRVVIALTASDPSNLLPTIVSRCQVIRLGFVPADEIAAALRERFRADADHAERLAHLAEGQVGWAIEALQHPESLAARNSALDRLIALESTGHAERFAYAEQLAGQFGKAADEVYQRLALWQTWWRDQLLVAVGCHDLVVNHDRLGQLEARVHQDALTSACRMLRAIQRTVEYLRQNVNPRLALDALVLEIQ